MKPVVAIYSTFLQRAYDQLIHDVAIQNLPVVFALDRGGLVGADGATHAGSFDIAYLRCIPNVSVLTPADENECRQALYTGVPAEPSGRRSLSARRRRGRRGPGRDDRDPVRHRRDPARGLARVAARQADRDPRLRHLALSRRSPRPSASMRRSPTCASPSRSMSPW
jgi:hypothetical protein